MAELSPLRRRMIEDMTVRNLSPATQQSYLNAVSKFSRYFGRSPDRLGLEDVHAFQVHLVATGISWPALNQIVCALRFFALCGRPHKANYVASCNMWRTGSSMLILRQTADSYATYWRGYSARRKAMTSGWRDHPPVARRVLPRANVASARFFVARSVSA